MRRRDRFSVFSIRLADLGSPLSAIGRSKLLRCLCYDARFVIAPLGQDRPRDARQLVGERGCQNIVMQPLRCSRKHGHEGSRTLGRDKISLANPANSGLIAENGEISVRARMRGGAERTGTACQARSRYRTGLSRVIHRGNSAIKCR